MCQFHQIILLLFFVCIGYINLRECTDVFTKEIISYPITRSNIVEVITHGRTYLLSASTKELMEEWHDVIKCCLSEIKNQSSPDKVDLTNNNDDNVSLKYLNKLI